ncbi:hypothetical protein [Mycobacterium malmoense]|uniref:hypothetical protein n=1 Tax=Mycobacterium malmoense TaxID=1780 RepID=UPI0008F81035|nr:hypothetical protein [Mycobacterium malmoense]OIN80867.1 hypothetical protein BMG05_11070 [Mycobacterium malmoense]
MTVAKIEGSQLWAAQLDDDRYLPEVEKQMAQRRGEDRPPLHGYSRVAAGLDTVANQIMLLRAEMGRWQGVPLIKGPVFPAEKIRQRKAARDMSKINSFLDFAHSLGEGVAS